MTIVALLVAAALFVAYANGSNDNFKGVATLYGSGTAGYRRALAWGTLTTLAGSLCSAVLAEKLIKAFSAHGLVPDGIAASPDFLAAVALGAALTIFLATLTGFPISTTHALTGGLTGAGLAAARASLDLSFLGKSFFLPLMASPVLALILGGVLYTIFRWVRLRLGVTKEWCVCVGKTERFIPIAEPGPLLALAPAPALGISVGTEAICSQRYRGRLLGLSAQSLLDAGHYLSAGAVSFARGLNDAPKIVGLMLILKGLDVRASVVLVASAMALGGLLSARKVARTLSQRITSMNHGQGFTANLVTSVLVLAASGSGLPVSTTHVSCGALFGMGLITRQADTRVIQQIVLSWLLTLPIAATLAAATHWSLR